jgi:non-canonical (house-cleaning) NTP pyrophosphatase
MKIGFYTSKHYFAEKKSALEEALNKLGIKAEIVLDESFTPKTQQAFGFEELFERTKAYASDGLKRNDFDVSIGVENSLSLIYSTKEWYYTICVALEMRDGRGTSSFTPGISIPAWMVKEVQDDNIKIDVLTEKLAGEGDPVAYFSGKLLTRKDLMVPALLLAFSNLNLEQQLPPVPQPPQKV